MLRFRTIFILRTLCFLGLTDERLPQTTHSASLASEVDPAGQEELRALFRPVQRYQPKGTHDDSRQPASEVHV